MNTYVINPLSKEELREFLDDKAEDIIKYFLLKSLFSQPESRADQKQLPIQIPKEHIEQWFTQSLDVKPVGAGSYPIDIYNDREKWGADIKMLNIKLTKKGLVSRSDSGEASLGQKFSGPGVDLDSMFANKKYDQIKDSWVKLYQEKYFSLKKDYDIKKIYYFFILRPGTQIEGADFYFSGAVIDLKALDKVGVERATKSSVFLNQFIQNEYGNTKIYKAKKRLELRLKPKAWIESGFSIKITTSYIGEHINLREEKIGPDHLKKQIDNLKNVEIRFEQ